MITRILLRYTWNPVYFLPQILKKISIAFKLKNIKSVFLKMMLVKIPVKP
ncbi:MAG: hypothetical protein JRJ14_09785 [Deltaproteobacteria bacterium]|nr:hypothetical protein [Deltaproteobacteria bacterium]